VPIMLTWPASRDFDPAYSADRRSATFTIAFTCWPKSTM
jgi:hypothetical protein